MGPQSTYRRRDFNDGFEPDTNRRLFQPLHPEKIASNIKV